MLRRLNIRAQIFALLVSAAAVSVAAFAILMYRAASQSLRTESFRKLTALREMKAQQIEDYFRFVADETVALAASRTVVEATAAFRQAFAEMREESNGSGRAVEDAAGLVAYYENEFLPRLGRTAGEEAERHTAAAYLPASPGARRLQELYVAANPHPAGEKDHLIDPGDGGAYTAVHRIFHPLLRDFRNRLGYYDLFLVDADTGDIVYSVSKEVDFATSLATGPYRDSNLGRAVRTAHRHRGPEQATLVDFAAYQPSYLAPAAFLACPIPAPEPSRGILVVQLPIHRINEIMTSRRRWAEVGLGETGETYLVGEDLRMRTPSRFFLEAPADYLALMRSRGVDEHTLRRIEKLDSTMGLQTVDTGATRAALAGRTETGLSTDYRGVPVLTSYRPLRLPDVSWVLVSQIDVGEAFAPLATLRFRMGLVFGGLLAAVLVTAFVFAGTMTRPIQQLTAKAEALAQGDLEVPIDTRGGDEIAHLAGSFDAMRQALRGLILDLEQRVEARTQEARRREREFRMLADNVPALFAYVGPDLRYRFVDRSYEAFFQKPVEDILGQPVSDLMDAQAWRTIEPRLRTALSGHTVEYETEIPTPTGEARWFKATYVPNREGDRVEGVFVLVMDITKRKAIEETLRANQADLRRLSSELALTAERERQRIASELHDELGQILAMCHNELDRLDLSDGPRPDRDGAERLRDLLTRAVEETRELTFELSSPLLHSIGLASALEQLCRDLENEYGLRFVFFTDDQPKPLTDAHQIVFFRSVRELLINAVRHAEASEVRCSLSRQGPWVRAEVQDDGAGFDAARAGQSLSPRGGFGLFNMRECVTYNGGRLEIASRPGEGTRVLLDLPATETESS